ncbi:protein of unknown function (plasmid) [Rhodovastum atsumiense]|nr:protein of unknown function [Rhodovastum atsumiense]
MWQPVIGAGEGYQPSLANALAALSAAAAPVDVHETHDEIAHGRRENRRIEVYRLRRVGDIEPCRHEAADRFRRQIQPGRQFRRQLIPVALNIDLSSPFVVGEGTYAPPLGEQGIPDTAAGVDDVLDITEDAAGEIAVAKILPQPLDCIVMPPLYMRFLL